MCPHIFEHPTSVTFIRLLHQMHDGRVSRNGRRTREYVSNERRDTVVLDDNPVCEVDEKRRKQSWDQCATCECKQMIKVIPEQRMMCINEWTKTICHARCEYVLQTSCGFSMGDDGTANQKETSNVVWCEYVTYRIREYIIKEL